MKSYRLLNLEKFKEMERLRARKRRANGWKDDPEKIKVRNAKRTSKQNIANAKAYRKKLLLETIGAYGGKCSCCGEMNPLFMTIDHINDDGAEERRKIGDGPSKGNKGRAGVHFYGYLKSQGFPKDRYRIMCFNCNCGRARNGGVCPHQERA